MGQFPLALGRRRDRISSHLVRWVKKHPWLYLNWVARGRLAWDGTPKSVETGTELVLDAFPRSGITFAVHALRLAQRRPVAIAHHLHALALVRAACRRGLPTLVPIRSPDEAVSSLAVLEEAMLLYRNRSSTADI